MINIDFGIIASTIAAIITLLAMPSSVLFNELTRYYLRENVLIIILIFAFILPIILGLNSVSSYNIILIITMN